MVALLQCTRREIYHAPFRWESDKKFTLTAAIRLDEIDSLEQIVGGAPVVIRKTTGAHGADPPPVLDAPQRAELRYAEPDAERLLEIGVQRLLAQPEGPFPPVAPLYLKSEAFRKWERKR